MPFISEWRVQQQAAFRCTFSALFGLVLELQIKSCARAYLMFCGSLYRESPLSTLRGGIQTGICGQTPQSCSPPLKGQFSPMPAPKSSSAPAETGQVNRLRCAPVDLISAPREHAQENPYVHITPRSCVHASLNSPGHSCSSARHHPGLRAALVGGFKEAVYPGECCWEEEWLSFYPRETAYEPPSSSKPVPTWGTRLSPARVNKERPFYARAAHQSSRPAPFPAAGDEGP
ncbi:hypothetical protein SKAU_G00051510 [Synaphobranchus kaupii]|uniref:Uncharacterized protein n=1 Tax=Synaphobranchus kaupii TaxID=118154 RepID=A0A9Q1G405_SYNKA|nr:hypothetical protein SKAU_G00051510 [Synaphobranchus kaupii]